MDKSRERKKIKRSANYLYINNNIIYVCIYSREKKINKKTKKKKKERNKNIRAQNYIDDIEIKNRLFCIYINK